MAKKQPFDDEAFRTAVCWWCGQPFPNCRFTLADGVDVPAEPAQGYKPRPRKRTAEAEKRPKPCANGKPKSP